MDRIDNFPLFSDLSNIMPYSFIPFSGNNPNLSKVILYLVNFTARLESVNLRREYLQKFVEIFGKFY